MLLKVAKNYCKCHGQGWVMFDEILDVHYHVINQEKFLEITKDKFEDYPFHWSAVDSKAKFIMIVEMVRRNGTNLYVAFGNVGYLLNDEGKTIETLNPHSRQF